MKWYQKTIWRVVLLLLFSLYLLFVAVIILGPTVSDTKVAKVGTKEEIEPKKEATISAEKKAAKEAEAKKKAEGAKKEDEQKKKQLEEYTQLDVWDWDGSVRSEYHYLLLTKDNSKERIKSLILELKKNCPEEKAGYCDYMLWDDENAYMNRDNSSKLSNEYAEKNKAHLAGYLNSGGLYYYYGGDEAYLD